MGIMDGPSVAAPPGPTARFEDADPRSVPGVDIASATAASKGEFSAAAYCPEVRFVEYRWG